MYYAFAERKRRFFFDRWEMCEVAFDTSRRYLYYSEKWTTSATWEGATGTPKRSTGASQSPTALEGHRIPPEVPPVAWRRKMKVNRLVPVATEQPPGLSGSHVVERDLFRLEFHGHERPLALGEMPPYGPLLRPSTSPAAALYGHDVDEAELVDDPFLLTELFDALRSQFEQIAASRRAAEAEGLAAERLQAPLSPSPTQTISSPRPSDGATSWEGRSMRVVLRCRDEYEFRRLWFVVQSVLGYDKLTVRPYLGLPPYDPRNRLAFAHVPMALWPTLHILDKAVFYALVPVAVCRTAEAEATTGLYLCLTHDTVLLLRRTGRIPQWVRLQDVHQVDFHPTGPHPFLAFRCDAPGADLLLRLEPPFQGATAAPLGAAWGSPSFVMRRLLHILHQACLASSEVRRVVELWEVADVSAEAYARRQAAAGHPLRLHGGVPGPDVLSCPLPKEQLAGVWLQTQREVLSRRGSLGSVAIPIYETTAPSVHLSRAQLRGIARALARARAGEDEIVGMPLAQAQQIDPAPSLSLETPQLREPRRGPETPARRVPSTGGLSDREGSEGSSYYHVPGACYLAREEASAGGSLREERGVGGSHHLVGPPAGGPWPLVYGPERTIGEIVERSLAAMRDGTSPPDAPPGG